MTITGSLIDGVTNKPITAGYFRETDKDGNYIYDFDNHVPIASDGTFTIDFDATNESQYWRFGAPGYNYYWANSILLMQMQPLVIKIYPASQFDFILPGTCLALFLLTQKKKKKVEGIGKLEAKDVYPYLIIGGVLIALGAVNKLLQALGIEKSPGGIALDNISKDPTSFWNPNYYQNFSSYTDILLPATAANYADIIYHDFGPFGYDIDSITAVFHSLKTKTEVSYLAKVFNDVYQKDLFSFLKNGWWPEDHLSESELTNINSFLSNLPTN